MKYLVLLAILAVVLLLFFGKGRQGGRPGAGPGRKPPADPAAPPAPPAKPAEMLACAHCGLHLPRQDAVFDVGGRPYCSPEHRVTGPR